MAIYNSDFLIIGSGIAGLSLADKLAKLGSVNIITKRDISASSTNLAQGGIAAVMDKSDSFDSHIKDTLKTGCGLSNYEIVKTVIQSAPKRINELLELGVNFSKKGKKLDLGIEGGHSKRRVVHANDMTGSEIESKLIKKCSANPNIRIYENYIAVDLILGFHASSCRPQKNQCFGAYALDNSALQKSEAGISSSSLQKGSVRDKPSPVQSLQTIHNFLAGKTILATGGASKVYLYTSNGDEITGDGMAMAFRAGLKLVNMEFVQFHPTCLYHPKVKSFLISEAVRGEGGILRLKNGEAFMRKYSKDRELASRDIVARAIDNELKKSGNECVYLDITRLKPDFIKKRFPTIYGKCLSCGINILKEPIPVVPAAHFFCGGIEVDPNSETKLKNLFAVGEVSHTGLHGANRLASNSLLEGTVFAHKAYLAIKKDTANMSMAKHGKSETWNSGNARPSDEAVMITHNWAEIRTLMWNYVGIVRSDKRLERAAIRMKIISDEILKYYWDFFLTKDLLELRNIACIAQQIIRSAQLRKESRGLHYTIDYPKKSPLYVKNTEVDRYGQKKTSETRIKKQ
ncbi:MAG: FAD-binding protein [Elusimicrobia bacterium]|nr:FAD-binding protein [Elusimicrobiota bacterium]